MIVDIGVVTSSPFRHKKSKILLKKQVKFTDDLHLDVHTTIPTQNSEEEIALENIGGT
jgi:hypothetical protein